jgi:hypothetical protein
LFTSPSLSKANLVLTAATLRLQATLCLGHEHTAHNHQFQPCEETFRFVNSSYKKLIKLRYFKCLSEQEHSTSLKDKVRNLQPLLNITRVITSWAKRVGIGGTGTIGKEMHSRFFMEIMKEKHYPDDLICERNMKMDIKGRKGCAGVGIMD